MLQSMIVEAGPTEDLPAAFDALFQDVGAGHDMDRARLRREGASEHFVAAKIEQGCGAKALQSIL